VLDLAPAEMPPIPRGAHADRATSLVHDRTDLEVHSNISDTILD
jgi:hypothetical protein